MKLGSEAYVLTWDRLRVFAAVARHGSVRAAAETLHITGPAVSQHLHRLEKEAGCSLVEPDGRGIRLTHAGRVLAASAQAMVDAAARAELDLTNLGGLVVGPLRIGAVASALRSVVPRVLQSLTDRHPRLEPEVSDGEAAQMIPALHAGQLDAVVMESWTHAPARTPPGIATSTLVLEDALVAVPTEHPLAHLASVPLTALRGEVWTSCPPGSDAHEALIRLLHRFEENRASVRYCVADYATQLQLVAASLAVALVPRMAAAHTPEGVQLIPCRPAVTRTVAVATVRGAETPPIQAFLAEMERSCRSRQP
ncbi:LysR family transcriptional regulator [Streptomyces sp. NPDC001339]|uniref:LysR family transcriptional regulator n=1 Tax=Streptomyces sp. NPDC001339 TaxID=3364563 RepID=UPI0036B9470B